MSAGAAKLPESALAQATDNWKFTAIVYAYLPDIGGSSSFSERGGSSVAVDASKIVDSATWESAL